MFICLIPLVVEIQQWYRNIRLGFGYSNKIVSFVSVWLEREIVSLGSVVLIGPV